MKLGYLEAVNHMRAGAILMRQKDKRADRFFIEPGGEVAHKTFRALQLNTNVVDNRDGMDRHSQSWKWER